MKFAAGCIALCAAACLSGCGFGTNEALYKTGVEVPDMNGLFACLIGKNGTPGVYVVSAVTNTQDAQDVGYRAFQNASGAIITLHFEPTGIDHLYIVEMQSEGATNYDHGWYDAKTHAFMWPDASDGRIKAAAAQDHVTVADTGYGISLSGPIKNERQFLDDLSENDFKVQAACGH